MNHVLEEIRLHIQQRTGDTYLKRKESDLVCSALVKEYPVLADPDTDGKGFVSKIDLSTLDPLSTLSLL